MKRRDFLKTTGGSVIALQTEGAESVLPLLADAVSQSSGAAPAGAGAPVGGAGTIFEKLRHLYSANMSLRFNMEHELTAITGVYRYFGKTPQTSELLLDTTSITHPLRDKADFFQWLNKSAEDYMKQATQLAKSIHEFGQAVAEPKNPLSAFWKEFNTLRDSYDLQKLRVQVTRLHSIVHDEGIAPETAERLLAKCAVTTSSPLEYFAESHNIGKEQALNRMGAHIDRLYAALTSEDSFAQTRAGLASMTEQDQKLFGAYLKLSPEVQREDRRFDQAFRESVKTLCDRFGINTQNFINLLAEHTFNVPWDKSGYLTYKPLDWSQPRNVNTIIEETYKALKTIPLYLSNRRRAIHDPHSFNAGVLQEVTAELPIYVEQQLIPQLMQKYFPGVNLERVERHYQRQCRAEEAKEKLLSAERENARRLKRGEAQLQEASPEQTKPGRLHPEKELNWTDKHKGRLAARNDPSL